MRGLSGAIIVVLVAVAGCGHEVSPLAKATNADEILFQKAKVDFTAGQYAAAQAQFDRLVADYPRSSRHAEAWYLAGRCRYQLAMWNEAVTTLQAMRAAYPLSRFLVDATYYTG